MKRNMKLFFAIVLSVTMLIPHVPVMAESINAEQAQYREGEGIAGISAENSGTEDFTLNVSETEAVETEAVEPGANELLEVIDPPLLAEEEVQKAALERSMSPSELGYDPDSIIVAYDSGFSKGAVAHAGDEALDYLMPGNDYVLTSIDLNDNKTVDTAIREYENMPGVLCAQPNYLCSAETADLSSIDLDAGMVATSASTSASVNDSFATRQWYLDAVNVPKAWDAVQNRSYNKVKVFVLDTGCSLSHADLNVNLSLSREIIDGQLCELQGDSYLNGVKTSAEGHGTMVSGVIAGIANNSYGIAGIASCYDNSVLDLVVVDVFDLYNASEQKYQASIATIIKGLYYALENGAKIVNMSLGLYGTEGDNPAFKMACDRLNDSGVVLVAAAGNKNNDQFHIPSDFESVISVMATDENNNKASFSAHGEKKDICAPGVNIYSTYDSTINAFAYAGGTSLATPIVTGTIAMMRSVNPYLTVEQIKNILYESATDLGNPGRDIIYGYGIVNVSKSVESAFPRAVSIYPIYGESSISLGCTHEGKNLLVKYRWEYCDMSNAPNQWVLLSDWNSSEWCTWKPDANSSYAVVCKLSALGNGEASSQAVWYVQRPQMNAKLTGTCVMPSGGGILLGCTANTDKYYTALYIYDYAKNKWIVSASSKGAACWYQANGLEPGVYMAYFCTEETSGGRKLSTSYYNFNVN